MAVLDGVAVLDGDWARLQISEFDVTSFRFVDRVVSGSGSGEPLSWLPISAPVGMRGAWASLGVTG